MNLRLLAVASLLASQVFAQNAAPQPARVLLQSGVYSLSESSVSRLSSPSGRGTQVRVMAFSRPLTELEWASWSARGAVNHGYLPLNAYLVEFLAPSAWEHLDELPFVAGAPFSASMKLSNQLARREFPDYAWVGAEVEFFVVPLATAQMGHVERELGRIGRILESTPAGFRVQTAPANLDRLAAIDGVQFIQPKEAPGEPENLVGVKNHRANAIRVPFPGGRNYRGTGVVVGHGDDGDIEPHVDFKGRIVANLSGPSQGDHGDHVAGTIFGAGNIDPDGEGQAPGASLVYYDYPANLNNVDAHYQTYGVRITASSYSNGCNAGYTSFTQQMDQDIVDNYHLMHVFSAGNNGTANCNYGAGSGWGNITGGQKQGKNVIAVANLQANDAIAGSSSRGPAHDGRIKPDVAALGTNVYSCVSPNGYGFKTGTSMACPGTAGVLAQLYDAYRQTHSGQDPHGGLMKAILMNTADDLGQNGPDFLYGYGRMNALRAARAIEQNHFLRDTLIQGGTDTVRISVPSGKQVLRVMLHWTDPAATINAGRALVNNLNGQLKQGTSSWLPWVLNPTPNATALNSPAVQAVDSLNTAEQFEVLNPAAGDYDLIVNGSIAQGGSQEYWVTWTWVDADVELTYPVGGEVLVPGQITPVRWDAEPNGSPFQLSYSQDNGATWVSIANPGATASQANWQVPPGVNDQMWLRITRGTQGDTTDYVMGRVGVPTNLNHQWTCPDSFRVTWSPVPGAAGYVVYKLGATHMDSVGTTTANAFVFTGSNPNVAEWVSVAALTPGGKIGKRAVAIEKPAGIQGCVVSNDAALTAVLNPAGRMPDCQPTGGLPVEVRIANPATTPLTSVPLAFQVNGGSIVRDTVSLNLTPGQSSAVVLTATASAPTAGSYALRVWTELSGDQNPYNDTLVQNFNVVASGTPSALPFSQDFSGFSACATTANCGSTNCLLSSGWVNAANGSEDVHDWRTRAGSTPTAGTGPTGGANGGGASDFYLYLESSSCTQSEALLYSPCIDLTNAALPQLSFSAHLLGTTQGELHVDVLSGGRWILDAMAPITGNQGSNWLTVNASLVPYAGNVVVLRFRGITGNGATSDIAIDNISVSEVTSAPSAAVQLPSSTPCLGQVVQLFDQSSNSPSNWRWIITPRSGVSFVNGTDSTSQNPWVAFSSIAPYTVQLIASNSFGADTATVANGIALTAGAPLPFAEPFAPGLPLGWSIDNPDNGLTWTIATPIGSAGTSTNAVTMNFFNYSNAPQEDGLITPGIDLTGSTLPYLVFDVAYAPYDPTNYIDGLRVEYSTNCGSSWQPTGYLKTGTTLATKASQTTNFTPSLAGHWRRDSIALPASIAGPSVKFRFVGLNGYGNNLYLDNIQVYDLGASAPVALAAASVGDSACVLDSVYFTAVNSGNAIAQWNFGLGSVPSIATGAGPHAVYYFSPGAKTVTLSLNGAGGTDADTLQFTTYPQTAANWTYRTDTAYTFWGQATGVQGVGLSYLWNFGDGTTASTPVGRHVYATAGTYPVSLTVAGACGSVTLSDTVTVSSIGLDEAPVLGALAPNPTEGWLSVVGPVQPDQFQITDLAGRVLHSGTWPRSGRLDLRGLAAGTYVVELQHGTHTERRSVVKF
ncbi:MAG: S8 family serine peptidase [Schleiferiaceae bacterium]